MPPGATKRWSAHCRLKEANALATQIPKRHTAHTPDSTSAEREQLRKRLLQLIVRSEAKRKSKPR